MVFQTPTSTPRTSGQADPDQRAARAPQAHELAELKAAPPERWLDPADAALDDADDFDIIAWFAVEDEEDESRCMTECWYG